MVTYAGRAKKTAIFVIAAYIIYGLILVKQIRQNAIEVLLNPIYVIKQAFSDIVTFCSNNKVCKKLSQRARIVRIIAASVLSFLVMFGAFNVIMWFALKLSLDKEINRYIRSY